MSTKNTDGERRRQEVAKLYLQGFNEYEIAKHLAVPVHTIRRDIDKNKADWEVAWSTDGAQAKATKIAELAYLKKNVYDALFEARRFNDLVTFKSLADLILKIVQTENKIYKLYQEAGAQTNLEVEDLIKEYERQKPKTDSYSGKSS